MEANENASATPATHKELREAIEKQLEQALSSWKEELGEKRFRKRIKKAGKLFGKKLKHKPSKATLKTKRTDTNKKKKAA